MSEAEQLLKQLRQRKNEPVVVRIMLADIAATHGQGFAAALARTIERERDAVRKGRG